MTIVVKILNTTLKLYSHFSTVWGVRRKINSLRVSLARVKRPKASGSAAKPQSRRAEWFKRKLEFLNEHCGTRPSTSNLPPPQSVSLIVKFNLIIKLS